MDKLFLTNIDTHLFHKTQFLHSQEEAAKETACDVQNRDSWAQLP